MVGLVQNRAANSQRQQRPRPDRYPPGAGGGPRQGQPEHGHDHEAEVAPPHQPRQVEGHQQERHRRQRRQHRQRGIQPGAAEQGVAGPPHEAGPEARAQRRRNHVYRGDPQVGTPPLSRRLHLAQDDRPFVGEGLSDDVLLAADARQLRDRGGVVMQQRGQYGRGRRQQQRAYFPPAKEGKNALNRGHLPRSAGHCVAQQETEDQEAQRQPDEDGSPVGDDAGRGQSPGQHRAPQHERRQRAHHHDAHQPVQVAVVEHPRGPHGVDQGEGGEGYRGPAQRAVADPDRGEHEHAQRQGQPQPGAGRRYSRGQLDLRFRGLMPSQELKHGSHQPAPVKPLGVGHEPAVQPGHAAELDHHRSQVQQRERGYRAQPQPVRQGPAAARLLGAATLPPAGTGALASLLAHLCWIHRTVVRRRWPSPAEPVCFRKSVWFNQACREDRVYLRPGQRRPTANANHLGAGCAVHGGALPVRPPAPRPRAGPKANLLFWGSSMPSV